MSESENSENEEVSPQNKPVMHDSSSSESDIENYLQKPEDLNLNSTFFKSSKTSPVKRQLEQTRGALSDSDSDDPLSLYVQKDEPIASTSKTIAVVTETKNSYNSDVFNNQNRHVLELEEAKKQVEAYIARRKAENTNTSEDVTNILAAGEKPFDLAKDLAEVGFHPSDFESDNESEKGEWEEVETKQEKGIIPKEGVEITVAMPNAIKKKKGIDLMAAIKRRMNRIKKENQVYVHKVHLLCWIAHGNYINNVLNQGIIMTMALSLLPSKDSCPQTRTNLKYLEQITKWYHKTMKYVPESDEKPYELEEKLQSSMADKMATNANVLVYIFVSLLRALGMQCRIVLSLQVEPLRPPNSELISLKQEPKSEKTEGKDAKPTTSESKQVFKKSEVNDKKKNGKVTKSKTKESDSKSISEKVKDKKTNEVKVSKVNKNVILPSTSSDVKIDKPNLSKLSQSSSSVERDSSKSPDKSSKRQTRSRTTKPSKDINSDDDFKKPESTSKLKLPTTSTTSKTRSKSASNQPNQKKLPVPGETTTKRSRSATVHSKKVKKVITDIDATVAALEALESSKPNLKTLTSPQVSTTSEDDDFGNRSMWRKSKSPQVNKTVEMTDKTSQRSRTRGKKLLEGNPEMINSMFQSDDEKQKGKSKNKLKVKAPTKRNVPQVDGNMDCDTQSSSDDDDMLSVNISSILQVDGAEDTKPKLKNLKSPVTKTGSMQSVKQVKELTKVIPQGVVSPKKATFINLSRLKSPSKSQDSNSGKSGSDSYYSPDKINTKDLRLNKSNVKNDIVNLVKKSMREEKYTARQKTARKSYKEEDSDSDFAPEPSVKKRKPTPQGKVKRRVLPRSQIEALEKEKAEKQKQKAKGIDLWVEVFLEEEEKWISADVVTGKVHCIKDIYNKASHPVSYILAWDNKSKVKDVTNRYCVNWNTVTRKLRIDPQWWTVTLQPYIGVKNARDKEEDEDLAKLQLDQPLPKTISEYKDHPLYVLKRHLLKFQALYPPDPPVLGFVRNEEVYSRDCVYVLHSRDIWLKHAKTVKPGEQPYKIVKARPTYDKLSKSIITDKLLEIFGVWQVQDYDPPTAENGIVPRNAYGNVELFKPCMLPKKCVHLQLPGLKKVATRLKIDCATAVTGFDFHGGWNHAIYDGFVVCEEFKDILIDAWEQEQEEITKREQEKYEKRVFGNWRRLIKAAMIRRRLKLRYDFSDKKPEILDEMMLPEELEVEKEVVSPSKPKRPKFMSRK